MQREERGQRVRKAAAKSEYMAASGGPLREGCCGRATAAELLGAAMSCFLHDFLVLDTRYPYLSGDAGDKNVSPVAFGCQNLPIKTPVRGLMTCRNRRLPDGRDNRMVGTKVSCKKRTLDCLGDFPRYYIVDQISSPQSSHTRSTTRNQVLCFIFSSPRHIFVITSH